MIPKVAFGTATYNTADQTIDWNLRKLTGGQETTFSGKCIEVNEWWYSWSQDVEDDPRKGLV